MMKFPGSGLYAITQTEGKNNSEILQQVEAALRGGTQVLQYRDKTERNKAELGKQLLQLCKRYQVPLLINDDAVLAKQIGADGVHVGKDDGSISTAREILGSQAIIGQSCYNDLDLARTAQQNGADYVAFGRFFPSGSKPLAAPAEIETLHRAKSHIHLPVVAIGGILPENGGSLLAAGANLLAVIGGIFDDQAEQAARAYSKLFES